MAEQHKFTEDEVNYILENYSPEQIATSLPKLDANTQSLIRSKAQSFIKPTAATSQGAGPEFAQYMHELATGQGTGRQEAADYAKRELKGAAGTLDPRNIIAGVKNIPSAVASAGHLAMNPSEIPAAAENFAANPEAVGATLAGIPEGRVVSQIPGAMRNAGTKIMTEPRAQQNLGAVIGTGAGIPLAKATLGASSLAGGMIGRRIMADYPEVAEGIGKGMVKAGRVTSPSQWGAEYPQTVTEAKAAKEAMDTTIQNAKDVAKAEREGWGMIDREKAAAAKAAEKAELEEGKRNAAAQMMQGQTVMAGPASMGEKVSYVDPDTGVSTTVSRKYRSPKQPKGQSTAPSTGSGGGQGQTPSPATKHPVEQAADLMAEQEAIRSQDYSPAGAKARAQNIPDDRSDLLKQGDKAVINSAITDRETNGPRVPANEAARRIENARTAATGQAPAPTIGMFPEELGRAQVGTMRTGASLPGAMTPTEAFSVRSGPAAITENWANIKSIKWNNLSPSAQQDLRRMFGAEEIAKKATDATVEQIRKSTGGPSRLPLQAEIDMMDRGGPR